MSRLTYVFVHGLNGSGEYDEHYRDEPYWGNKSGDVVAEWRSWGAEAHAASVSPQGSAWDRACELYAQLAGTRTDYGKAHSAEYRHERFGRDFSGQALIPSWDDGTRLVLIAGEYPFNARAPNEHVGFNKPGFRKNPAACNEHGCNLPELRVTIPKIASLHRTSNAGAQGRI